MRRLLGDGHRVMALVRPRSDLTRLAGVSGTDFFSLHRADLADPASWNAALRGFRPEAVAHLAWQGVRKTQREDPGQTENVSWTLSLLRLSAKAGARRFVGVGSQAEYGVQNRSLDESAPVRPTTLYGIAKLAAGQLTLALAERLGVSAAWVRLFSLYGPGEPEGGLLTDFARSLESGAEFPLTPCEQRWDYLHVEDAAEALSRLLAAPGATGVYNLGSGRALPLKELIVTIRDLVRPGAELALGRRPYAADQIMHLQADTRRLKEAIGWDPRVPIEEGLRSLFGRPETGAAER